MIAHTPGPWVAVVGGADGKVRCSDGRYFLVGDLIYHEDNKANARLIAAAPDLLAALKGLLAPEPGGVYATNDVIDAARAAVAQAEGR